MKGPIYQSDDGKLQGTREVVEAYEKSLNPLAKFGFPFKHMATANWRSTNGLEVYGKTASEDEILPLLNLMPLVEELRQQWWRDGQSPRPQNYMLPLDQSIASLLLAYEKALGIEQPS